MNKQITVDYSTNQFRNYMFGNSDDITTNVEQLTNSIADEFKDNLYWKPIYKNLQTDITYDVWIYEGYTKTEKQKKFTSYPYNTVQFSIGDYISYVDEKSITRIFLITMIDDINTFEVNGTLQECNYTLKFQHPTTGTILSYPCIDESPSSVGIDANNTITTLNGIHRIKLPFDDNTKLIGINKRFFIDKYGNTVAKVTNINNTEFNYGDKGLIVLTLQQDSSYNPTTDKNGICNYIEPTVEPTPTPSPSGYTLTIASSGDFNLGLTRTLTPTLRDDLGSVVTDWVSVWGVNYNGMTQSYFTITYVGNQCKVTISEDAYDIIDGVLELTCTVSGDTVSGVYSGIVSA